MNDRQLQREADSAVNIIGTLVSKIEDLEQQVTNLELHSSSMEQQLEHAMERNDDLNDTIKDLRSILETPIADR